MLSRERVAEVIRHGKPDRIPIYGWVTANLTEQINKEFGSIAAFEDKYEFDFAHLWGSPQQYPDGSIEKLHTELGRPVEPKDMLDVPFLDVNNSAGYDGLRDQVRHHRDERGRFTYVQSPGLFEHLNGVFGIENHLTWLLLHPEDLKEVYARQAEWNRQYAMNCIDVGIDMIHISDDWGTQKGLMFSPATWWDMIYPYHKITADAVKAHDCFLSLHCDGNCLDVMDGIIKLGFDVVHPYQESAGMPLSGFKEKYIDEFVVMGGLDIQTTIGFGKLDVLRSEIERVMRMFAGGGLLFCTSHFVQDHCSMEELTFAFDTAYELSREVCA
jgi:uroporphyrinogen decarboxylase